MIKLNKINSVRSLSLPKGLATAAISISVFLAACGNDSGKTSGGSVEDQEVVAISDKTVSGVSQKGPFVNGSSVTVQELDGETLAQTGNSYEGIIKNDMGEFSVKVTKLASQYALLKANGFYRNEVSGEKSKSQVTLYALTDLSNRDEVNVNLLTHLEYERSLYLASVDSMTVAAAKKQAEKEVLASFGITGDFANSEDLNIFGTSDENAALLAISILMQGDLNEADFSERLANYAADIETDGKWDDAKTATEIADWGAAKSLGQSLSYIRTKITNWGLSAEVPAFEKYVDNYWWQNYGLGTCEEKREGEIKKNENSQSRNYKSFFICENGAWRVASDTEYDTYQQKCDEDGKIVYGNVNKDYAYDCDVQRWRHASNVETALGGCVEKRFGEVAETEGVYYICQKREWRKATDIEKDTYSWKIGNDADVKYGDVVKTNCYVFEDSVWRSGNESDCSLGLRGCTALRQDTVGKGSDKVYHICDAKSWRDVTTYEKDTFGWKDSTDGAIKKGNVTDTIYVFDKTSWRVASNVEAKLGGCVSVIADSVGKVGSVYYICKSNKWVEASSLEYDTYRWIAGKDGDSKTGSVDAKNCYVYEDKAWRSGNATDCSLELRGCTALRQDTVGLGSDKVWYKCDAKIWRIATDIEKDTATWGHNYKEADVKYGLVNTSKCYVYENGNWRLGNEMDCSLDMLGCTKALQDTIKKGNDGVSYICRDLSWEKATETELETYRYECSKDGKIVWGISKEFQYVCDSGKFRLVTDDEIRANLGCVSYTCGEYRILSGQYSYYKCTEDSSWTFTLEKLNRGTMTDSRDGRVYQTIGIKSQMWMAENLQYRYLEPTSTLDSSSYCYKNDPKNCERYGRRYLFSAAIDSVSLNADGIICGFGYKEGMDCYKMYKTENRRVEGICPNGWHLPGWTDKWQISEYGSFRISEMLELLMAVGVEWDANQGIGGNTVGRKLRSTKGYEYGLDENGGYNANGTDEYGFNLLPCNDEGGACSPLFWSSVVCSQGDCVDIPFYDGYEVFYTGDPGNLIDPITYMEYGDTYDQAMFNATAPVRCIKNED